MFQKSVTRSEPWQKTVPWLTSRINVFEVIPGAIPEHIAGCGWRLSGSSPQTCAIHIYVHSRIYIFFPHRIFARAFNLERAQWNCFLQPWCFWHGLFCFCLRLSSSVGPRTVKKCSAVRRPYGETNNKTWMDGFGPGFAGSGFDDFLVEFVSYSWGFHLVWFKSLCTNVLYVRW